ncbi:hypothetical protein ACOMHN_020181 [Nucella lapillus]
MASGSQLVMSEAKVEIDVAEDQEQRWTIVRDQSPDEENEPEKGSSISSETHHETNTPKGLGLVVKFEPADQADCRQDFDKRDHQKVTTPIISLKNERPAQQRSVCSSVELERVRQWLGPGGSVIKTEGEEETRQGLQTVAVNQGAASSITIIYPRPPEHTHSGQPLQTVSHDSNDGGQATHQHQSQPAQRNETNVRCESFCVDSLPRLPETLRKKEFVSEIKREPPSSFESVHSGNVNEPHSRNGDDSGNVNEGTEEEAFRVYLARETGGDGLDSAEGNTNRDTEEEERTFKVYLAGDGSELSPEEEDINRDTERDGSFKVYLTCDGDELSLEEENANRDTERGGSFKVYLAGDGSELSPEEEKANRDAERERKDSGREGSTTGSLGVGEALAGDGRVDDQGDDVTTTDVMTTYHGVVSDSASVPCSEKVVDTPGDTQVSQIELWILHQVIHR